MQSNQGNARGPSKEEMSEWPLDKRLQRIQRIFVEHHHVQAVNVALDGIYEHGIRLRESLPGILVGDSRCGKSELLKRYVRGKTGVAFPDKMPSGCVKVGEPGSTVVYLDCYNGATPRQACVTMLNELFDQRLATRGTRQQEATDLLMRHFQQEKVQLLVIDEAQKMVDGRSPADLANWIISLRNAGFFRIFISGDRSMYDLVDTVKVLRDSKKALVELRPFAYREQEQQADFAKFLRAFDKDMPFLSTPLSNKQLEEAFFFATRGRPGTLAIFLETAAYFAFRRMKEKDKKSAEAPKTIELVDLVKAFDQMMAGEARMLGINPFTHSGALPSYAKSLDEELEELQRAIVRPKPRGRNRGGRLQD